MTSSTTAVTLKLQKFLVVDFLIMSMRPHKHNGSWQWKLGQEEKKISLITFFFLLAFWQTQPNAQLHEKNAYLGDQIGFDRVSYIAFFSSPTSFAQENIGVKRHIGHKFFFLSLAHIPPVPFFEDQGTIEKNASIQIILMKKGFFASIYLIHHRLSLIILTYQWYRVFEH